MNTCSEQPESGKEPRWVIFISTLVAVCAILIFPAILCLELWHWAGRKWRSLQ